ncbi:MAG: hypothetical protein P4L90_10895 [Rhodopila sp.]|nr:hypothetical protein [Rhodopila sp.]
MYRCYLIRAGRIAIGDAVNVETLNKAIAHGRRLLAAQPQAEAFTGIEIWRGTSLLYSDKCHTTDTGCPAHIISPFQTYKTTNLSAGHPSATRSLLSKQSAVMDEISSHMRTMADTQSEDGGGVSGQASGTWLLRVRPAPIDRRRQTVDYHFVSIRQWISQGAFLMKGLDSARTEFRLVALAHNLRRVINIWASSP